jgi:phenylpyruvate tautomerase
MPLIKIQTNTHLPKEQIDQILPGLSQKASEWLDKPEGYIQIIMEPETTIMFAGKTDPSALIEVRSLGFYGHSIAEITQALCTFIQEQLDIPQDRIFINFFDLERSHWGWNSKTLG